MRLDRYKTPGSQRGAVAIVSGAIILVAVGCAAIVIDAGRLYMEQRSLQRIADTVAIDTAQQAGLCAADGHGDINGMATAAAARNGFSDVSFTSSGGCGDSGTGNIAALCWIANDAGQWVFSGEEEEGEHQAVHVQVSRTVPESLIMGGLFGDEITLTKQAVAKREPVVSLSVGSGLAEFDSTESEILNAVLGGLLNTSLSLSAVTYEGLASADVSLAALVDAHPAAGTVNELLSVPLSVSDMMAVFIDAAAAGGESTVGLNGLLGAGVDLPPVSLGDILSVSSPTAEAGFDADINLLDLVSATALLAKRENAVEVPLGMDISLPVVGDISAVLELYVIEPPQIAIGRPGWDDSENKWRTEAKTAQVRTSINTQIDTGLPSLGSLANVNANIQVGLALDAVEASAAAESVACSTYSQQRFEPVVIDAETNLATISLGRFSNGGEADVVEDNSSIDLNVCVPLLCINPTVTLQADSVSLGGKNEKLEYPGSREDLPWTQGIDGVELSTALDSFSDTLDVNINGLGVLSYLLDPLVEALLGNLLVPLVSGLDVILEPIFDALGIRVGAADITLVDVEMERVELVR